MVRVDGHHEPSGWPTATSGRDPFVDKVDVDGQLTHGHLPENDNHGDTDAVIGADPLTLPDGRRRPTTSTSSTSSTGPATWPNYQTVPDGQGRPVAHLHQQRRQADQNGLWHTITACKAPCNRSTGIAYPLADGDISSTPVSSAPAGPPTADRVTWNTPADLPTGTYTYFCRIHPFMRGAFRVTP